jgi:hypothetical protein
MTVGLRLFLSSATFGVSIAVVYWLWSHDPTGTLLLGLMAVGLVFVAGYIIFAERGSRLVGDDPHATMQTGAGEDVGTYTLRSRWPVMLAASLAMLVAGLVIAPAIAWLGLLVSLAVLWELVRESS